MDMSCAIPESHPLHRLFRGLTESAFMHELGIGDPSLVQYMAELLVSFVPSQALWRMRDAQGRPLAEVTAMVAEAEATGDAERKRQCHRHVGDFTLFWTGVYPERLRRLRDALSKDHFIDYCAQGKRSYYIASTFADDPYREEAPVLRRLSAEFELCAYGLNQVRHEWERRHPGDAGQKRQQLLG